MVEDAPALTWVWVFMVVTPVCGLGERWCGWSERARLLDDDGDGLSGLHGRDSSQVDSVVSVDDGGGGCAGLDVGLGLHVLVSLVRC